MAKQKQEERIEKQRWKAVEYKHVAMRLVFEYFLEKFALAACKQSGQFYTIKGEVWQLK